MRKLFFIISVFCICILASCNRDDEITKTRININEGDIELLYRSSLSGIILNENGEPIDGVKILVNGEEFFTNQDGIFNITNTLLNDTGEIVTFSKSGYFTQFEKIIPTVNSLNSLFINMYDKSGAKTIKSNENSNTQFANGDITFFTPKNNLITSNSERYDGIAKVYLKSSGVQNQFSFPIIPNSGNQNIEGIATSGSKENIYPVFSFLVNCESENGKELHFKDSVSVKISKDILPILGQNIKLWHYDEKNGNWIEKSGKFVDLSSDAILFNIKNQGYYIISPDFSEFVQISGTVKYIDGSPARRIDLFFLDKNSLFAIPGFADDNGNYAVQVPKGSDLIIVGMHCSQPENEYNLGIVNSDRVFDIEIPELPKKVSVSRVYNNQGQPAVKAFAGIISGFGIPEYYKIMNDSLGQDIHVTTCSPAMVLYDLDELPIVRQSEIINLSQPVNTFDYPAKDETDSYFYVNDNNNKVEIFEIQPIFFEENGIYYIANSSFKQSVFIKFADAGQNKFEGDLAYITFTGNLPQIFESDPSESVKFEISTNNSNEISGSFTGKMTIENVKTDITGYFRIQK